MKRVVALILLGVALLALFARIYDTKFTYIFGVDSYWFARMASYVVRQGSVPDYDPLHSFIQPAKVPKTLAQYIEGWTYLLVFGKEYDKYKMMAVAQWLSPLFGALGSVGIALISFSLFGPIGLIIGGFLGALVPGYAYRTLAGFYEDDATAAFLFFIVYFIIQAMKAEDRKKYWRNVGLAATFAAISALSWAGSPQIALALLLSLGGLFLLNIREKLPQLKFNHLVILTAVLSIALSFLFYAFLFKPAALRLYNTFTIGDARVLTVVRAFIQPLPLVSLLFSLFGLLVFYSLEKKTDHWKYGLLSLLLGIVFLVVRLGIPYEGAEVIGGVLQRIYVPPISPNLSFLFSSLLILIFGGLGALIGLLFAQRGEVARKEDFIAIIVPLLAGWIAGFVFGYNWILQAISPVLGIIRTTANPAAGMIAATVGEEVYGFFSWPYKYGIMAFLALFSLPIIVWYAGKKREGMAVLPWFALTWYAAWSKLKFAYYFGFTIAFGVAALLTEVIKRANRRAVALGIYFIIVSMVATAAYHEFQHQPGLMTPAELQRLAEIRNDLQNAGASSAYLPMGGESYPMVPLAQFIDENLPKEINVANWWNSGHYLTFLTERRVLADNTNQLAKIVNPLYARLFFSSEENLIIELNKIHADYFLITPVPPTATATMARYMFSSLDRYDPRILDYVGFYLACTALENNTHVCGERVSIQGFSRINPIIPPIPEENWNRIPEMWVPSKVAPRMSIENTNTILDGREYIVYRYQGGLLLVPPRLNDAIVTKLWFGAPLKYFKIVYSGPYYYLLQPSSSVPAHAS